MAPRRSLDRAERRRRAEDARRQARGSGFPPAFAPVEIAPGETLAYVAPRSVEGDVERQPALGGGSVLRDAIDGTGFHIRKRASAESVKAGSLVTVRSFFAWEDETGAVVKRVWRQQTISVPRGATPRERAQAIYRATIAGARNILEHDYDDGLALMVDRIHVSEAPSGASASPPRVRRKGKHHRGRGKVPSTPAKAKRSKAAAKGWETRRAKAAARQAAARKAAATRKRNAAAAKVKATKARKATKPTKVRKATKPTTRKPTKRPARKK